MTDTYTGTCICGAVEIEAQGAPVLMGYCHCDSCRHWSAGPVNAFTLWPPAAIRVVRGEEHLGQYNKTENSERRFCTKCGGHVMTGHPGMDLIDVYAAILPSVAFEPTLHLNYAETVLPMPDGLQKFRDLPAEAGGSGELLPE